jgi:hypothetical protein
MLNVILQPNYGLVILEPHGALSVADFSLASEIIDPYIAKVGGLRGLMINSAEFPGWDSFTALVYHLKFIKNHHQYIAKVALVTNSMVGDFAAVLVGHFVRAQIKFFTYDEMQAAKYWLLSADLN